MHLGTWITGVFSRVFLSSGHTFEAITSVSHIMLGVYLHSSVHYSED